MPARRILITGATGFIGSVVARHCVAAGYDVLALVRPGSDRWRLSDVQGRVRFIVGDVLVGLPPIERCSVDLCIHLAWDVTPGEYLKASHHPEYQRGTLELAKRLAAIGCARLIGVGTCLEYEPGAEFLCESTRLNPRSVYAAAKRATFEGLQPICETAGMALAWARLFYQYGPAEDARRIVPTVVRAVLEGKRAALTVGDQVRDFLHVNDVAGALCAIAESDLLGPVNVGSQQAVTIASLALRIGELLQRPDLIDLGALPTASDEPPRIVADTARLRAGTGWTPRVDLTSGLLDTIDWWTQRRRTHGGT